VLHDIDGARAGVALRQQAEQGGSMKHTISRKGAALAGTAALVATASLWPSVAGADASGHRGGLVVTGSFVSDRVEETFIDNDANGRASLGDEIVYTNSVRSPLGPTTDYGSCVLHEVNLTAATATLHCTNTGTSSRGSVTAQGTARSTLTPPGQPPRLLEPARLAISGGSGRFQGASGEITITRFQGSGLDFVTSGRVRVVLPR
jgi:hypothetical protein